MKVNYLDELAGQIRAQVPPDQLPDYDTTALFRAYAVLLLAKGDGVTHVDVHNAWSAWMAERNDNHESLIPYDELSSDITTQDQPYVAAIQVVARRRMSDTTTATAPDPIDSELFPGGLPINEEGRERLFELYKIMVASSEGLVARRQGVNTFFLTINGAILTAAGLVLGSHGHNRVEAAGLMVFSVAGVILALAWKSLITSFGQLNTGKFRVINRLELEFPAAIYLAEWKALGEGRDRTKYLTFTSREVWAPWAFFSVHLLAVIVELTVVVGWWTPA